MKNKKILICTIIIIILILLVISIYLFSKKGKKSNLTENVVIEEIEEVDKNQISYNENVSVEEIKNETGTTGDTNIYEIQQEYDGRKVATVKASVKYKVAFAGMIKNSKPKKEELDEILNKNIPEKNGIWVNEKSRSKILEIFNNDKVNSKYKIDSDGYLKVQDKNSQNDIDKKIEKIINGNKQYIFDISSVCYIVDDVTGDILDYNFEKMDEYQTYEYFDDEDKCIVFINENTKGQLTKTEIFESVIDLL